jgi:hypothetical protein
MPELPEVRLYVEVLALLRLVKQDWPKAIGGFDRESWPSA